MRKRFLSALLALCMVLTLFPGTALAGNVGETQLTANSTEKQCYEDLKAFIQKVADGSVTSSVFTTDPVSVEIKDQADVDAMSAEIKALVDGYTDVVSYLLIDCPANFYWYNKTLGMNASSDVNTGNEDGHITVPSNISYTITVTFAVSEDYADPAGSNSLDTAKVNAAKTAIANADAIVTQNASKSDYEKLVAYKNAICAAVSYNTSAAEDLSTPYGDPWQMISVFDNDNTTNVVCEGYSKAFQYLCDQTNFDGDITCYTVTGNMSGGTGAGAHMWNVVVIDGETYLVDVTNSDADTVGQGGELFLAGTKNAATTEVVVKDKDDNVVRTENVPQQSFPVNDKTIGYTWDLESYDLYDGMTAVSSMAATDYNPLLGTVTIAPATATVDTELTATYTAPADSTGPATTALSYTWYVGNTAVTGNATDTYTVAATDAGKDIYVEVRANGYDGTLSSNKVTVGTPTATIDVERNIILTPDSTTNLNAKVTLNGTELENAKITYAVSDNSSISVSSTGVVTVSKDAKVDDTATITISATLTGYEIKDVIVTVTVQDLPAQNVSFTESSKTVTFGDDSFTVAATSVQGGTITYSSSNEDVAKVNATTGEVTIVGAGEAKIIATAEATTFEGKNYGTGTAEFTLTVAKKDTAITVTLGDEVLTYNGELQIPSVTVTETAENGGATLAATDYVVTVTGGITAGDDHKYTVSPAEGGNYNFASETGNYTIEKAKPDVTADDIYIPVGASWDKVTITGTSSIDGKWGLENPNAAPETDTAGETTVLVMFTPDDMNNYGVVGVNAKVIIQNFKDNNDVSKVPTIKDVIDDAVAARDSVQELLKTVTSWISNFFSYNSSNARFVVYVNGKPVELTDRIIPGVEYEIKLEDASEDEVAEFKALFGTGVVFTPEESKDVGDEEQPADKDIFLQHIQDCLEARMTFAEWADAIEDWFRGEYGYSITVDFPNVKDLDSVVSDSSYLMQISSSSYQNLLTDLLKSLGLVDEEGFSVDTGINDEESYYISVIRGENGEVIVGTRYAEEGERVTVSVYPDNGYELDELTVTNSRGRGITLRDLGDGKYSFTMPDARVTVEATFVKEAGSNTTDIAPIPGTNHTTQQPDEEIFTGLGTPGISGIVLNPAPMPFSDVRYTDWFCESVEYMWKHYLMSGVSDSSFAPNLTTSRAMIWTVLARMNNIRTDVNPGYNWYENGMQWAMLQGITDGTNPLADITREQLATMLWRNAGSPSSGADLSSFSDAASVSAYAQTAIRWAVSNGVINGENGLLNPQGTATRAQVAAMVARYGNKVA